MYCFVKGPMAAEPRMAAKRMGVSLTRDVLVSYLIIVVVRSRSHVPSTTIHLAQ